MNKKKTTPLVSISLEEKEDGKYYEICYLVEQTFLALPTTTHQMASYFVSFFKPYLETLPEDQREQYQKDTIDYINKFMKKDIVDKQ